LSQLEQSALQVALFCMSALDWYYGVILRLPIGSVVLSVKSVVFPDGGDEIKVVVRELQRFYG